MSIHSRTVKAELTRPGLPDDYGQVGSTHTKIADIDISITKNNNTHDVLNPQYDISRFIGLTLFVGVLEGDLVQVSNGTTYIVKDIGNAGTLFQVLYLDIWQK
jgi:hypothetical protein